MKIGQKVTVVSGMTGKVQHEAEIIYISPSGRKVVATHPTYVTKKATYWFNPHSAGLYVESYGGTSYLNNRFTAE